MKNNRRKRVTYRPGKANGVFGIVCGGIFVLIGLFIAIPAFGAFGVLWTLFALGTTGYCAYAAFGKQYSGPEISIEEEGDDGFLDPTAGESRGTSAKDRLTELRTLYEQRLITQEEYEEKRKEILKEL